MNCYIPKTKSYKYMLHDGECLLCSFSFKKVVRDDTGRKAKTNSP